MSPCNARRPHPHLPRRGRRSLRIAIVSVIVAGCASMHDAPPPEQPLTMSTLGAKAVPVEWPREDWWRRYGDPQLDALMAEGLAGSPTLSSARARIARADAAAGVARSALFPRVDGNGTILYQRYSEHYI